MKYFFLPGGVISGLGKGITISSIGVLLQKAGYSVTSIKIDPYLNCDAGTMSPFEHGEVFVLDDGGEGDLDLGNYERFLHVQLTKKSNITTGKVYKEVIERERRGDYLGKTVQIIPHVSDEIQNWIEEVSHYAIDDKGSLADICLVEVGGTVGDIESFVFLEAIRQFIGRHPKEDCCLGFVSLVPFIGEQKTKPTQHGVQSLRSLGLFPDLLCLRCSTPLIDKTKAKISLFTDVPVNNCLSIHDCRDIYSVPQILNEQHAAEIILAKFHLPVKNTIDTSEWLERAEMGFDPTLPTLRVAFVGKYTQFEDAYLSVRKALLHSTLEIRHKLIIQYIESSQLEKEHIGTERSEKNWAALKQCDCVLVPGGFGNRGTEGMINAIEYARANLRPFLGICLGMQLAVVEYARHVCHLEDADSTEFSPETKHPVVIFMPEIDPKVMGGNMRLGGKNTNLLTKDCLSYQLYGKPENMIIRERHRHRYEVNPDYTEMLSKEGLKFVGTGDFGKRMEIIELPQDVHPFFVATQFHPEFTSHPGKPNPIFLGFISTAAKLLNSLKH